MDTRLSMIAVIATAALAFVAHQYKDLPPAQEPPPFAHLKQYESAMPKPVNPLVHNPIPEWSQTDYWCMAKNIYHEAGVDSYRGKLAVGTVTMNRLDTGRWGKSVCSVVFAKAQFSWTLDSEKVNEQPSGALWDASVEAAYEVLHGARIEALQHSLHYHATYVKPYWSASKKQVKRIGTHVFYHG